jgi:hypothetical protein
MLAADLANQAGGVDGHPIEIRSIDVPGSDAAAAVDELDAAGGQPATRYACRRGSARRGSGASGC